MLKYHIQTVELASAQKVIQFNLIPQDYSDLYVVISGRSDRTSDARDELFIQFNGDTSNYSSRSLRGSGSAADTVTSTAAGITRINLPSATTTSNTFGNGSMYILNYNSNIAKSISVDSVMENNATFSFQDIVAGLWNNTSPITRLSVFPEVGNFTAGSTISLYGVKRGSDGVVNYPASGGVVTTSGGYTYHTFNASGTFTTLENLSVEGIVVAGGGSGGGSNRGGGGGAGGFKNFALAVAVGSYTVVVGSGGSNSGVSENVVGNDGSSSSFLSILSTGGGGGGRGANAQSTSGSVGRPGGSGGGGGITGQSGVFAFAGGAGISGQGNDGGSSGHDHTTYGKGGGGGGAGAVGSSITANGQRGNGGAGLAWNENFYAGGGGGAGDGVNPGGLGGIGGGGDSGMGASNNGVSGIPNTGGGGGAANGTPGIPGSGGSGVVIIRYLTA